MSVIVESNLINRLMRFPDLNTKFTVYSYFINCLIRLPDLNVKVTVESRLNKVYFCAYFRIFLPFLNPRKGENDRPNERMHHENIPI